MKHSLSAPDRKLCMAALRLAAKKPWNDLSLAALAKEAGISAATLEKRFTARNAIVPLMVAFIGDEALKSVGTPEPGASVRDRLFETLMARFDILQKHRAGILSILSGARQDPKAVLKIAAAQMRMIRTALRQAGQAKAATALRIEPAVLWVIYMLALRRWAADETLDMSGTMAALDLGLARAEQAATAWRGVCA